MPYKSPFGLWGSYGALAFCCLVALTKNFDVFIGGFDYKNFITGYLVSFSSSTVLILTQRTNANNLHQGIPLYLIMIAGYKIVKKTKQVKPEEADLWTGKAVVDADEAEWIAKEAYEKANGLGPSPIYRYTLGYLF